MTSTTSSTPQQLAYRKRKYQNSATSDNELSDEDESSPKSGSPSVDDDKRAHHNELERRRRDHIKDHFINLKTCIPLLEGEKSSRALILKRAVDYINLLQTQVKDYKLEMEDLKRRNDNLQHQANGLKPFLNSLQLQPNTSNVVTSPTVVQPVTSPPTTSTSFMPVNSGGSLTSGLALYTPTFGQASTSPHCPTVTSSNTTPPMPLQNTTLLANLLLQNPNLLAQLQFQQQNSQLCFEPLTPPSSASNPPQSGMIYNGLSPELSDAQARLLASSLAIRERQFAAVAAANL